METAEAIERWHRVVRRGEVDLLDDLLADDVVFHSPVVHTPQEGKAVTRLYLSAAAGVFSSGTKRDRPPADEKTGGKDSGFRYVREIVGPQDALLEFMTEIDGIQINGIDLIRFNASGQITDFKVMVRPLKAVNKLHQLMAGMLKSMQSD
ncbi:nuclear transport factor 2 family protein [Myxococcota bacterium]|jgi:hypothetical protein|nr:nuclear transport factor 2 family protein [Myxococcota bacterium]